MEILKEDKKEKLSLKLRALEDMATRDIGALKTESIQLAEQRDLYNAAKLILEDVEELESVGMDRTEAFMISLMLSQRKYR